jgi:hypothetical protein
MEITNWGVLEAYIENAVKDVLREIGEKVNQRLRDMINHDVYDAYQPEEYERTYQLRESVTTSDIEKNVDGYKVEIYHDTSKIFYNKDKVQHGSNKDISKWIPEIIAFNLSGDAFGSNQFWHNRDQYFYETLETLKTRGDLSKWFKDGLRARGLNIG